MCLRFERQVCTRVGLILVNYASVRSLLVQAFGPDLPVRVMPYTVEAAFKHPRSPDDGRPPVPREIAGLSDPQTPLVVAVSRHEARKGLDLLLESLATLRARRYPARVCLLGPGPLLERHRALARTLGLEACTAIPGQVADPWPYLRHADVFVLPSLGEGGSGSMSLLEALMAGTAVVASACDGIPEDVTHGHDALLVEPGTGRGSSRPSGGPWPTGDFEPASASGDARPSGAGSVPTGSWRHSARRTLPWAWRREVPSAAALWRPATPGSPRSERAGPCRSPAPRRSVGAAGAVGAARRPRAAAPPALARVPRAPRPAGLLAIRPRAKATAGRRAGGGGACPATLALGPVYARCSGLTCSSTTACGKR